jgi:hydrogenase maturation factor HypE
VAAPNEVGVTGTTAVSTTAWTHLAMTYDGATLRLFVNGTQVTSRALTTPMATSTGLLRFGGENVWGDFFQGRIDEVRIYNRALTAAEIQADMSAPITP